MSVSLITCPTGISASWCSGSIQMPSRPNIFDLPGMLAWTIINWLMHALGAVVGFISQDLLHYGFFTIIDSPTYQFLYGLMRDVGFMLLGVMVLAGVAASVFPKSKQYSQGALVRLMISSCIGLVVLLTRIPIVVMQLLFYSANQITVALLKAGLSGLPQSLTSGSHASVDMHIIVIDMLLRYGQGLGFLYFLLLMGILGIFILGILAQVLGQIAGLVLTLFIPLAIATYNFEFGRKWTRALFEFAAVTAFAQILSTVYLLFVFSLVISSLASGFNVLQTLVTFGMALLSVIPAKRLLSEFASLMHGSAGSMLNHASAAAGHPASSTLFNKLGAGPAGPAGAAGGGGAGGGGVVGGTAGGGGGVAAAAGVGVAAGLLAGQVNDAVPHTGASTGTGSATTGGTTGAAGSGMVGAAGGTTGAAGSGGGRPLGSDTTGGTNTNVQTQHDTSTTPTTHPNDTQSVNSQSGVVPPPSTEEALPPKTGSSIIGSARDKVAGSPAAGLAVAAVKTVIHSPEDPMGAAMSAQKQFKERGRANVTRDKERLSHMLDKTTSFISNRQKPSGPPPTPPPPPPPPEE